jgi:hypothetical protein
MRVALRAATVGALVLALATVAVYSHQNAAPARASASASSAAPLASINLGELFGDENEADENEPDEGAPQQAQSGDQGSDLPFGIMVAFVVAAVLLVAYVVLRIRRLVLRARAWGRDLWARL